MPSVRRVFRGRRKSISCETAYSGSYPMCPSRQPEAVGRDVRFLWMVSAVQMMLPMMAPVGTAAGALVIDDDDPTRVDEVST